MSMNEKKYPSMSVQMFYDVKYFSESLESDRGSKLIEANFAYDRGRLLHIKYNENTKALVIEIFE